MKTFLFYDIETSGLNPAFDQVLTFASIRTDLSLNEIDRQQLTICLRKDIVPSPEAFLTHGLTFEELADGISEYAAAKKIHQLFNTTGTISIGYNSLGFDDEFLRFMFYRNLLDPYSHQYANDCSRADILPVTTIFRTFHPDGLKWPEIDGKPTLKLEHLSTENQFETTGKAHEAMNDVEALIELSKVLAKNDKIWQYCLAFFDKRSDESRIKKFNTVVTLGGEQFVQGLMVSPMFGSENNYLAPVMYVGQSTAYKNQHLWVRLDSDDPLGVESEVEMDQTFVIRKRFGDAPVILPYLDRFKNNLPETILEKVQENILYLSENASRLDEFINYHCSFKYPFIPQMDLDASLYQDGFFSMQEKKDAQLFHASADNQKESVLEQISSQRVKQLINRIIARNFNTDCQIEQDTSLFEDEVIGYRNDVKLDLKTAIEDLKQLEKEKATFAPHQQQMLVELRAYLSGLGASSA